MSETPALSSNFTSPNSTVSSNVFENIFCGVYLLNVNFTSTGSGGSIPIPIPCSIFSLTRMAQNDTLKGIIVYPGFKVEIYQADNFLTLSTTIDNTDNDYISIRRDPNLNTASSIKVYYKTVEITLNVFTNSAEATIAPAS